MNRVKYIVRLIFLLIAVSLLVYLNRKTNNNTVTVAEFKFKMFEKIRADSLDSRHKLDLVLDETTKFLDDSSRVREGVHYLTALFGLLVVFELGFLIVEKRNYEKEVK
jgi:hypothetical protein